MTSRSASAQESTMGQFHSGSDREQVIDTMIGLTRLSNLHRAIVAGGDSMQNQCRIVRRHPAAE